MKNNKKAIKNFIKEEMKMKEVILKTYNITKKYGNQMAVNNVNMTIKKGEIYGFIGQNGAGKTTLIRLITGLIHKTGGEIELLGAQRRGTK